MPALTVNTSSRLSRCRRLALDAMDRLGLNLRGCVVLTEAATGNYALTAPLAALAGANEVLMLSGNSRFGSAEEALRATLQVAEAWGVETRLRPLHDRRDPLLHRADIVTNLGFVRPIDSSLLGMTGPHTAVALMFEAWEFRTEDVDLRACEDAGAPVAATDEHDSRITIMDYLAPVVLRLLFESGVEVVRACILVVGGGAFADPVLRTLQHCGAEVRHWDPLAPGAAPRVDGLDAVAVLEHRFRGPLIDVHAPISPAALAAGSPGAVVVHVAGAVNPTALEQYGVQLHPPKPAPPGHMTVATDYVGPRPVIDLHAAGLRVGQALVEMRRQGLTGTAAVAAAARACSLVQPLGYRTG